MGATLGTAAGEGPSARLSAGRHRLADAPETQIDLTYDREDVFGGGLLNLRISPLRPIFFRLTEGLRTVKTASVPLPRRMAMAMVSGKGITDQSGNRNCAISGHSKFGRAGQPTENR